MKSCPKCNRTFPDEGQKFCTFDGGLLIAQQTFDPNTTMRATSSDLVTPPPAEKTTSRELPDPNATIVESYAETVALPRNTGPTKSSPNTADFTNKTQTDNPTQTILSAAPPPPTPATPPPSPTTSLPPSTPRPTSQPLDPAATLVSMSPSVAAPVQPQAAAAQPAKKRSKLPWILAGVLVLLLLGGGVAAGVFFVVVKPMLDQRAASQKPEPTPVVAQTSRPEPTPSQAPSPSPEEKFVAPPNSTEFVSANTGLDGKLAEHYFDFSFYYPDSWKKDSPGTNSFVGVGKKVDNFPQETFSVGWYTSTGTFIGDLPSYPKRVEELSAAFAKQFPEYKKISEGPTTVNSMQGYEFRWEGLSTGTAKGDVHLWGRVVFLPTGNEGDTSGATLTMFATSLADDVSSVNDVGDKGQMPVILESFRFGKRTQ